MANANWPPTVNQRALKKGLGSEPEDNVNRFKPDVGPSVDHSRTITANERRQFDQWFTMDEYVALKDWRRDTLKDGILPFDRQDPETGLPGTFVFMEGGFKMVEAFGVKYRVSFILYKIA